MLKKTITLIIIFASFALTKAQEVLLPLQENPIIKSLAYPYQQEKTILDLSTPLNLPFIDDFSNSNVYPSILHWMDSNVFINNNYAISPISIQVATFDAINKNGMLYKKSSSSAMDYLTSRPIRLDSTLSGIKTKLNPADSIMLSFYIQPQGIGNYPDPGDSLVLEFKSFPPDTNYIAADTIITETDTTYITADTLISDKWIHVWSHTGIKYADFIKTYQNPFKNIIIPIIDTIYFRKDFQFRFKNYASIAGNSQSSWAGNADMWHLDYIYLNKNRSVKDSTLEDVATTSYQKSLLKSYQEMPWDHFLINPSAEMGSPDSTYIRNLSNIAKNTALSFHINDINGNGTPFSYNGGSTNLKANTLTSFFPTVNYTFNTNVADSALFKVSTAISTSPDINKTNDTASFYQAFNNYYALDDGTPEFGYGLNKASAKIAVKYNIRKQDTLVGIGILFNRVLNDANQGLFKITIWDDINRNHIIYQSEPVLPTYNDSINNYYIYRIEDEKILLQNDVFIGLEQITDKYLHIGWDANNTIGWDEKIGNTLTYYNIDGTWKNSLFKGSLMIRPYFGEELPLGVQMPNKNMTSPLFRYFPNPAQNTINIVSSLNKNFKVTLSDITGKILFTNYNPSQINISNFTKGYYIISFYIDNQLIQNEKLIIIQ